MRTTLSCLVLLSLGACGGAAPDVAEEVQAVQTRPPTDFNGTYDTRCAEAALALVGSFDGRAAEVRLPVRCELLGEAAREEARRQLEGRCRDAGLPGPACQWAAAALVQAADDLHRRALGLLPASLEVHVHTWDPFGRATGLYPATCTYRTLSGARGAWHSLIHNNAGPHEGEFATVGLTVSGLGAVAGLACAEGAGGAVKGRIDRWTGRLGATFALGRHLTCAASTGDRAVPVTFGIHYTGRLSGDRR